MLSLEIHSTCFFGCHQCNYQNCCSDSYSVMWSKVRKMGSVNSHQQVSHYVEPLPHKENPTCFIIFVQRKRNQWLCIKKSTHGKEEVKGKHITFLGRHTTTGTVPAAHEGTIRLHWARLHWGSKVIKSKKLNDVQSHNRWWVMLLTVWASRQVILRQTVTPSPKKNLVQFLSLYLKLVPKTNVPVKMNWFVDRCTSLGLTDNNLPWTCSHLIHNPFVNRAAM